MLGLICGNVPVLSVPVLNVSPCPSGTTSMNICFTMDVYSDTECTHVMDDSCDVTNKVTMKGYCDPSADLIKEDYVDSAAENKDEYGDLMVTTDEYGNSAAAGTVMENANSGAVEVNERTVSTGIVTTDDSPDSTSPVSLDEHTNTDSVDIVHDRLQFRSNDTDYVSNINSRTDYVTMEASDICINPGNTMEQVESQTEDEGQTPHEIYQKGDEESTELIIRGHSPDMMTDITPDVVNPNLKSTEGNKCDMTSTDSESVNNMNKDDNAVCNKNSHTDMHVYMEDVPLDLRCKSNTELSLRSPNANDHQRHKFESKAFLNQVGESSSINYEKSQEMGQRRMLDNHEKSMYDQQRRNIVHTDVSGRRTHSGPMLSQTSGETFSMRNKVDWYSDWSSARSRHPRSLESLHGFNTLRKRKKLSERRKLRKEFTSAELKYIRKQNRMLQKCSDMDIKRNKLMTTGMLRPIRKTATPHGDSTISPIIKIDSREDLTSLPKPIDMLEKMSVSYKLPELSADMAHCVSNTARHNSFINQPLSRPCISSGLLSPKTLRDAANVPPMIPLLTPDPGMLGNFLPFHMPMPADPRANHHNLNTWQQQRMIHGENHLQSPEIYRYTTELPGLSVVQSPSPAYQSTPTTKSNNHPLDGKDPFQSNKSYPNVTDGTSNDLACTEIQIQHKVRPHWSRSGPVSASYQNKDHYSLDVDRISYRSKIFSDSCIFKRQQNTQHWSDFNATVSHSTPRVMPDEKLAHEIAFPNHYLNYQVNHNNGFPGVVPSFVQARNRLAQDSGIPGHDVTDHTPRLSVSGKDDQSVEDPAVRKLPMNIHQLFQGDHNCVQAKVALRTSDRQAVQIKGIGNVTPSDQGPKLWDRHRGMTNSQLSQKGAVPCVDRNHNSTKCSDLSDVQSTPNIAHTSGHYHSCNRDYQRKAETSMSLLRRDTLPSGVCDNGEVVHITCDSCDQRASFLCSRCQKVAYCSPTCQLSSWKQHKQRCG